MEKLKGQRILKKDGDEFTEVVIEDALKDAKYVIYYFGAKSCKDCIKFTPLLRDIYLHAKSNDEPFEVIYISSDKSEEEMKEFAAESHGDWYFYYVNEDDDTTDEYGKMWTFRGYFNVRGIPYLVVSKEEKVVVTFDGVIDVLGKSPAEVLALWKEKEVDMDSYIFGLIDEKRETEDDIITNCCALPRYKPWAKKPPAELVKGMKLIRKVGEDFVDESEEESLKDAEIVGFYFSANWCGPCHVFTPILKNCYNELKDDNKSFEVIFISTGESEEEMKKYMQDLHGDWLGIQGDENAESILARKFRVDGIPALRIVNKAGDLIAMDGDTELEVNGAACYPRWMEGKCGATNEELQKYWADKAKEYEDEGTNENDENKEGND